MFNICLNISPESTEVGESLPLDYDEGVYLQGQQEQWSPGIDGGQIEAADPHFLKNTTGP